MTQASAIAGDGAPRLTQPPAPWPCYAPDERSAVDAVLASGKVNYWTGSECRLFEQEYAAHLAVKRAVALTNGSVALELPLRMWGIGPGDEVIVTPRSFIASASCAVLVGARPVFADVDRDSGNITAETIARVVSPRTRAIIPVHLGGWPCDMDPIMALARARGIKVLEDCAQAPGASYKARAVGSLGDAAAFSFCQDKIITTLGEGGLLATNDETLWERAWSFKDHGKTWNAVYERDHPIGFRWVHERFGTNWRLTEPQAAVGRIQLRKLPAWVHSRRSNAAILQERLSSSSTVRIPAVPSHSQHAGYRFYCYVQPQGLKTGWSRDRVLAALVEKGVPCLAGSCSEIYLERAFEGTGWQPDSRLPGARELGETSLAFLVHPTLPQDYMHRVSDVALGVLAEATR